MKKQMFLRINHNIANLGRNSGKKTFALKQQHFANYQQTVYYCFNDLVGY